MAAIVKIDGYLIFWVFAVTVLAVVGTAAILRIRQRFLPSREPMVGLGWRLEDLEAMRRAGQVSEQEFKVLRQRVLKSPVGPAEDSTSAAETNDNTLT